MIALRSHCRPLRTRPRGDRGDPIGRQVLREMRHHRRQVETEFGMAEDVVAELVLDRQRVRRAARSPEPVHPPQPRYAQAAPARLPELLVQVAFLATEAAESRMESRPGVGAATECAETLHRDLERLTFGIERA